MSEITQLPTTRSYATMALEALDHALESEQLGLEPALVTRDWERVSALALVSVALSLEEIARRPT